MQLHKAPLFFRTEGHIPFVGPLDRKTLYIDGAWVPPAKGRSYPVINPATEQIIGSAPEAEVQDAERAIAAARRAFDRGPWPRMTMQERAVYLRRFVGWLAARSGELAGLAVAEIGVPIAIAGGMHVALTIDQMTAAIDQALRLRPRALEPTVSKLPESEGGLTIVGNYFIMYDPVGVTSLFSAYNAPLLLNGIKIIPALIAGNTAIVKAPPQTPLQTLIFAEAAEAAGLPPGVVNFLTGTSPEIGQMLSGDPRIDLVSFTGSDVVGSKIMAQAAPTINR